MHIGFSLQDRRSQYRIALVVRIFLSIPVGYKYISALHTASPAKGGTLVEATLQKPNFLPYITVQDTDKFYQSLLFQGCVYPTFSGVQVVFGNDLCEVQSTDSQTFFVTLPEGHTWSDGTPVTLNDVYFTYKSIIKENYWNIPHLDGYGNIQISTNEDNTELKFIFPKATRDNRIFFTNFVLPAHVLANISLEEYMIRFLQDPIGSTCTRVQTSGKDADNFVFDLSACPDFSLKNYQIKWFPDETTMHKYIQSNKQLIDLSLSPLPSDLYTPTSVLLNSYLTFFINNESPTLTTRQKQGLTALLQEIFTTSSGLQDVFVTDPYVFTFPKIPFEDIKKRILPEPKPVVSTGPIVTELNEQIDLTTTKEIIYTVSQEITDKKSVFVTLPNNYTRVSITPNGGKEYFPVSYNSKKKIFQYNLSPLYTTIIQGENAYTVRGYQGDQVAFEQKIVLWYLDQPPMPEPVEPEPTTLEKPFEVIYFEDETTDELITTWKDFLATHGISDRFVFQGYTDPNSLEGKLTTKEYAIALRTITFGLKKDLSTLLMTDTPTINPSLRKNEPLSNLITSYFLTDDLQQKSTIQQNIQDLHRQQPQLFILGKVFGKVWTKKNNGITYPEKLYVLGWRKHVLQKIQLFQHVQIDRRKASDRSTFFSFLGHGLIGKTLPVKEEVVEEEG